MTHRYRITTDKNQSPLSREQIPHVLSNLNGMLFEVGKGQFFMSYDSEGSRTHGILAVEPDGLYLTDLDPAGPLMESALTAIVATASAEVEIRITRTTSP
jgi:hypothetical protein